MPNSVSLASAITGFGVEREDRREGGESFLARNHHVGGCAGDCRRLEEQTAQRMALAAGQHLAAFGARIGDVLLDLAQAVAGLVTATVAPSSASGARDGT